MESKAIIVETKYNFEVRCKSCGKLLFTFTKKNCTDVDKKAQNVTIVARCTRCKTDNYVGF